VDAELDKLETDTVPWRKQNRKLDKFKVSMGCGSREKYLIFENTQIPIQHSVGSAESIVCINPFSRCNERWLVTDRRMGMMAVAWLRHLPDK